MKVNEEGTLEGIQWTKKEQEFADYYNDIGFKELYNSTSRMLEEAEDQLREKEELVNSLLDKIVDLKAIIEDLSKPWYRKLLDKIPTISVKLVYKK